MCAERKEDSADPQGVTGRRRDLAHAAARRHNLDLAAACGVPAVAIVLDLPVERMLANNTGRAGRVVDDEVVRRQRRDLDEAGQSWIIRTSGMANAAVEASQALGPAAPGPTTMLSGSSASVCRPMTPLRLTLHSAPPLNPRWTSMGDSYWNIQPSESPPRMALPTSLPRPVRCQPLVFCP